MWRPLSTWWNNSIYRFRWAAAVTLVSTLHFALGATTSTAQPPTPATAPQESPAVEEDEEEGPLVADSTVGYLDNPIVGNQIRFRYDSSYGATQPARAEYIWPVDGQFGPGPGPETSVDYQDLSLYGELQMGMNWSLFGELPVRFANPEIQDNTQGLGDAKVGFKYALRQDTDCVRTLQLKLYIPTADGGRGLGTDHYSLEPGLLLQRELGPRLTGYGEIKDWIALDGSDGFAGNVLQYGLGASYRLSNDCDCPRLSAVAEFVGWTVLNGGSAITLPGPITQFVDATGDTIVNAKVGLRWRLSESWDVYGGYGRALTDQEWYSDVLRLELRQVF